MENTCVIGKNLLNTFSNPIEIIHKNIEYTYFCLKIINSKNIDKNILEISDQNRINIKVTLLYIFQPIS